MKYIFAFLLLTSQAEARWIKVTRYEWVEPAGCFATLVNGKAVACHYKRYSNELVEQLGTTR